MKRAISSKIVLAAVLMSSGKYDIPGTITIRGYDAWGNPKEERVPSIDWERLERDINLHPEAR